MLNLSDIATCFFLFCLQNTILYVFPDYAPNLMIPAISLIGLRGGALRGAVAGLWAGFLMDVMSPDKPGFFMIAFSMAGFFSGVSSARLFRESLLTEVLLPALYYYLICLTQLFMIKRNLQEPLSLAILAEAVVLWKWVFTILASPVIFAVLRGKPRSSRFLSSPNALR